MALKLKEENQIKIFILYLMDSIGYPLNYSSVAAIVIQDGIVDFFTFAKLFFALVDQGHIRVLHPPKIENSDEEPEALYEVSDTGRMIARDLSDSLMASVRERSYRSAIRHLSLKKRGAVIDTTFSPEGDHFLINCIIRDKKGKVLDLTLRADSKYQLDQMLRNYAQKPEEVFRGIVALLTGDLNYFFIDEKE